MTKLEFTISTLTSLLVGLMLILEVFLTNVIDYDQAMLNQEQQMITLGSNAYRMWQVVSSDCAKEGNDPAMASLLLRQEITPDPNMLVQPPGLHIPLQPVPPPSSHHP